MARPWPESIVVGVRLGEEAGYMPLAGLEHGKSFNIMFSMQDMVRIMGPNTAAYIQMGDQLGTLTVGKLAGIVLLDGTPLEGYRGRQALTHHLPATKRSPLRHSSCP